jgi:hypothetical protein
MRTSEAPIGSSHFEPVTPDAERTALEDMLRSEGWAIFTAHMGIAWGPEAYERAIDGELEKNRDPMDEIAITRRIRDTYKGVRASLLWPTERVKALKDTKSGRSDGFAGFRRGPRR